MKRHVFTALGILSLLAIVSGCNLIKPEEPPKELRDTIHSFASASVSTPSFVANWVVRTPDTLWNGVSIVRRLSTGSTYKREQYALRNYISITYTIAESDAAMSFSIKNISDLEKRLYVYSDNSNSDTLRSWKSQELVCNFRSPRELRTPITLTQDSVFQFQWSEILWQEREVPSSTNNGQTNWSIQSLPFKILSLQYFARSNFIEEQSKVVQASLTIEKYDAVKHRMSGRFSFKVIGSLKNELVEIQNGVFENAPF